MPVLLKAPWMPFISGIFSVRQMSTWRRPAAQRVIGRKTGTSSLRVTSILTETYFPQRDADVKALEKFKHDKSEPSLFRTEAAFTLALLNWSSGDRVEAAENYRSTIRIGRKAKEKERKKTVVSVSGTSISVDLTNAFKNVGGLIDQVVKQAEEHLANLEKTFTSAPSTTPSLKIRSDGSAKLPSARMNGIPMGPLAAPLSDDECDWLVSVGGGECDHCKKTLKKLGMKHLLLCSKCKLAFYCSADCQGRQWRAGHKDACRKPGQVKEGDYVRIDGLVSRPELNGIVVQVQGALSTQPGCFEVRIHGGDASISVAHEKLQQLRPRKKEKIYSWHRYTCTPFTVAIASRWEGHLQESGLHVLHFQDDRC